MDRELREAAAKRSTLYRARADRPQQRTSAVTHAGRAAASFATEFRFDGMTPDGGAWTAGELNFVGMASSTNSPYEMWDAAGPYEEVVERGAFATSLALGRNLDVPLVIEHDAIRRIARTTIAAGQPGHLSLSETDKGLVCAALLDPADVDVQYILPKLRSGLLSEMSFRFTIDSGEWSADYSRFTIKSANLQRGDVSLVGWGANPNTSAALREKTAAPSVTRSFVVRDSDLR